MNRWTKLLLRSAGFGGGFAVIAALVIGIVLWWSNRPPQWSNTAIAAKPTAILVAKTANEVQLEFQYALTNTTTTEYKLPPPEEGMLMRKLPKENSFEKLDGATWDSTIMIPPKQSVNLRFRVDYKLTEYDTSEADLDSDRKLADFITARLKNVDGLIFFDSAAKYKIEMPKNWDRPKSTQPKTDTQLMPPDTGDVFDMVYACQQATKLVDSCKSAGISSDNSPWVKYGGYPTTLRKMIIPQNGYAPGPSAENCAIAADWANYCKVKAAQKRP